MKKTGQIIKVLLSVFLTLTLFFNGQVRLATEEEDKNEFYLTEEVVTLAPDNDHYALQLINTQAITVTWSSSDESVVIVDNNGVLYPVMSGQATITAQAEDLTATCLVYVTAVDEQPEFEPDLTAATALTQVKGLTITNDTVADSFTQFQLLFEPVLDATGYQIYRATKKTGKYTLVATVYTNDYLDTDRLAGKTYYYKVRAFNSAGSKTVYGAFSAIGNQTTVAITVNKGGEISKGLCFSNTINLNFEEVDDADGYQIYRATKKKGKYKKVGTVTTNEFRNTGVTNSKKYYYKVRAYKLHNSQLYYGEFSSKKLLKTTRIVKYKKNYTAAKVDSDIVKLAAMFPDLIIDIDNIGYSAKGKKIRCFTIGHGTDEALIVGGMHAREHLATNFVFRMIEDYAVAYTNKQKYAGYNLNDLFNKYTIYVVPSCNPDGLDIVTNKKYPMVKTGMNKYSRPWYRNNGRGVNLNRNFDYYWAKGKAKSRVNKPDMFIYYGPSAASEPETQALVNICNTHDFQFMLSFHHIGNVVYYGNPKNKSWTANKNGNHYGLAKALKTHAGFRLANINSMYMTIYAGCFEDWFTDTYRRPGFCVELVPYGAAYLIKPTSKKGNKHFNKLTNWKKSRKTLAAAMAYVMK